MKRAEYLSWDEYFMGIALLSAQRSKDPGTQVGACICLLYTSFSQALSQRGSRRLYRRLARGEESEPPTATLVADRRP